MNEMECIRARHSVRAYKNQKIDSEKAAALSSLLDEINRDGNLHLQFCEDAGGTFRRILSRVMGLSSAPSVIACAGPDDDTLDERIGYYGEKAVLFAQSLGLNTCWAGTFKKEGVPAELRNGERLSLVIAIGYGEDNGHPRKSKKTQDVSSFAGDCPDWFSYGVEMALLAPTAINQQRFLISLNDDDSVTFTDNGGPFSKVDLGIVKYHFEAAKDYIINGGKRI